MGQRDSNVVASGKWFFGDFRPPDLAGAIASDTLSRTALEVLWFQLAACHLDHVAMVQHPLMLDSKLAKLYKISLQGDFTWLYQILRHVDFHLKTNQRPIENIYASIRTCCKWNPAS